MKIKKPDFVEEKHLKFLRNLNGTNSYKTKTLVEFFGLSYAEATVLVLYWEKTHGK